MLVEVGKLGPFWACVSIAIWSTVCVATMEHRGKTSAIGVSVAHSLCRQMDGPQGAGC